jgi:transglutaminase-like putative cysteine protease
MNNLGVFNEKQARTCYRVIHETHYYYVGTVLLSQQLLHMTPRSFGYQDSLSHLIEIDPVPQDWCDRIDYFGNSTQNITLWTPHQTLLVHAESTVELHSRPDEKQLQHSPSWESVRNEMDNTAAFSMEEPYRFLFESPHIICSSDLARYAAPSFTPHRGLLEAVFDLTQRIYHDFEFDSNATCIATPLILRI